MKKLIFVIVMSLGLFIVSNAVSAEIDAEYASALKLYNSKQYKEAADLLKEYVKKNPAPAAYYLMGYALYKLGNFDEANEYFKQAYLLDPDFSLEKAGLIKTHPEAKISKQAKELVPEQVKPSAPEPKAVQPEPKKEPVPASVPSPAPAPKPEVQKAEPQTVPVAPPAIPSFPKSSGAQAAPPKAVMALVAGFGIFMIIISLVLYIYYCLCLFRIAKKLDVPAPWTAWIPVIQIWTWVASAGKPWWWILLLLVPIVNLLVVIYLWLCITENLGKNKWLGLLMLLPVINLIFLGILAFSKSEKPGASEDFTESQDISESSSSMDDITKTKGLDEE